MKNYRLVELELKQKLQTGTTTREDISKAIDVARALGSESSRVMYAQIKRQVEANEEKETGEQAE